MKFSEENFGAHLSSMKRPITPSAVDDQKDNSELVRAPLFSSHVQRHLGETPFSQYGLIGAEDCSQATSPDTQNSGYENTNLIYGNHGEPWSAFVCGSQGTGKSHTLATLLENFILPNHPTAEIPHPLTAVAFHFDPFTSFYSTQLCELAYFCSAGIKVRVIVSPDNVKTMTRLYSNLPGLPADSLKPEVLPLKLGDRHLNIKNMMAVMNVKEEDSTPLYMASINQILRNMKEEQGSRPGINYKKFKDELAAQNFNVSQNQMLQLRMQLLDACLAKGPTGKESHSDIWRFEPGSLTIVDLSSEFVNSGDACALFTVCLNLFMAGRNQTGRVVVLDEAHKFLTASGEAQKLTESLTSIIRQQRHLGTRVIIATQEPTLDTRLLDLCNVVIVHQFSSPEWFSVLKGHLAGSRQAASSNGADQIFQTIVSLETGHALIFSTKAKLHVRTNDNTGSKDIVALGDGYIKAAIRLRITADGGRSITAQDIMDIEEAAAAMEIDDDEENSAQFNTDSDTINPTTESMTNGTSLFQPQVASLTQAFQTRSTGSGQQPIQTPTVATMLEAVRRNTLPLITRPNGKIDIDHSNVRKHAAAELGIRVTLLNAQPFVKQCNKLINTTVIAYAKANNESLGNILPAAQAADRAYWGKVGSKR